MPSAPPVSSSNDPPQSLTILRGEATVIAAGEAGKVSMNATPLRALFRFGFCIIKVRVDVPPVGIGFGLKNLEMMGGKTAVRFAWP